MGNSSIKVPTLLGLVFIMISCGGPTEQKENDITDSAATDSSSVQTTPATLPSTIVRSPENMMVVKHKVTNFQKWLASYESHDSIRLANGVHSYVIGRGVKDSNMVLVATKLVDIEKAKAFGKSAELKQAMKKGGVTGTPVVTLNTMEYQDTGQISTNLRSRTTFTVKDWDAWQKSFDSSRQIRLENGLVDRAYGHEADNNKKVTVVVAILDTAKANLFWKSEQLKKLRAASGATSEPDRFIYRVAKKY